MPGSRQPALYVWNQREAWELVRGVSPASLYQIGYLNSARICLRVCARVGLIPRQMRDANFTEDEADLARRRFGELVEVLGARTGSARERRWCELMGHVARHPEQAFWEELVRVNVERLGTRSAYFNRIVQLADKDAAPADTSHTLEIRDLTDAWMLEVATVIARWGALDESLPRDLRFQLSELAVVTALDAANWRRSWSEDETRLLDSWRSGVAIGIALSLAPDGRLFGTLHSHVSGGGNLVTWWERCHTQLNAVIKLAPGKWGDHARSTLAILKKAVPAEHRRSIRAG